MPGSIPISPLLLALDLAGTAVFAISGAGIGVRHGLDIFGVCVLAFVAGSGGGVMRDVLIGAMPPAAISQWQYVTVALMAGVITFWWHPRVERLRAPIMLFDAAGLGLFAVARGPEGSRVRTESLSGSGAGDADRNRRWHTPRRAGQGDSQRAARRLVCRSGIRRRRRSRRGTSAPVATHGDHSYWRDSLLCDPTRGDSTSLGIADS